MQMWPGTAPYNLHIYIHMYIYIFTNVHVICNIFAKYMMQMRPGTAPLARMSGPAAGESGAPAGKGGKGKDAKGAKVCVCICICT